MNLASVQANPSLSIIVPVRNGGEFFRQCLASLAQFAPSTAEVIVVIDGSDEASSFTARQFNVKVIQLAQNGGPARARNLGAQVATGEILFFLDADVAIEATTIHRVLTAFRTHAELDALIGSYDDAPGATNFLSQYKNLFHHYTHQTSSREASTFWGACGAIRRSVFFAMDGFDESYRVPCVEDIELGYRLKQAGYSIWLDHSVQVKHLKRWSALSLLKADFFYRALPWTELIWRDRQLVNDLNLQTASRVSVAAVYGLLAMLVLSYWWPDALTFAIGLVGLLLGLNAPVYQFFYQKRGFRFALAVIPWHWLYYGYSGLAFVLGSVRHWAQCWGVRPARRSAPFSHPSVYSASELPSLTTRDFVRR